MSASVARRFVGSLIDAAMVVLMVTAMLVLRPADPAASAQLGVVLAMLVQLVLETFSARTLGKFVTGTTVTDVDGNRPSAQQMLARRLYSSRVFIAALSLVREHRARHDRLAGTRVVLVGRA